jgi:PAS domain S-box-containing protein
VLNEAGTSATLMGHAGIKPDTAASPLRFDLSATPSPWQIDEAVRSSAGRQIFGLEQSLDAVACGPYPERPRTAFVLPILTPGSHRPMAVLVAAASPRLPLDETYRAFFDLVQGSVAAAIANARAYEDERRRAEALAELDHAKTVFFSNISHEFRTPLSLMLGPIEDVLNDAASSLPQAHRGPLEMVHHNALRLLKLVNALLDFSRIEAGRLQASFAPTDLATLTGELASNFRSACDRAGLRLIVDCPPLPEPVYVDADMWEKIVLNLLSNAFKFTFCGEIEVSLRSNGRDEVQLSIRDTGTGIAAENLPHLFERFHRIEGATGRTFEGSGIGLALVQELAKLHGGVLTVESQINRGSTFRVTLPSGSRHLPPQQVHGGRPQSGAVGRAKVYVEEALRWLPDALPARPVAMEAIGQDNGIAPRTSTGTKRPLVLLADDNADMRAYLSRILEDGGYEVLAVADGEAALSAMREGAMPDLVLTDVMMPRLGGFGLLEALRADPALKGLLVILLSARAGEDARVEGLAAGADDYLIKPFSARELLARVDGAVRLARARQEAAARERDLEAMLVMERGRAELREARTQIRISDAKYRLLMSQALDAILVLDPSGTVLEANPAAEAIFGQPRTSMIGRPLSAFFTSVEAEDLRRLLEVGSLHLADLRLFHGDGNERNVEVSAVRVNVGDEEIVLLTARDVTERKLLEQQLHQSQKMEAIGQLTGGIAHDFNNILTVISGTIDFLARAVAADPMLARVAKAIDEAAERGAQLTQRMLAFARRQRLRARSVDLNESVRSAAAMLQRILGEDVAVKTVLADDLWLAVVDPYQIADAVLNLAVNARDAMPNGGNLVIETANVHLDEHYAGRHLDVTLGDYVAISVTDSGTGMSPEVVERVFEPFFTTKEVGQGTGLGLSMVYGFVKQSGGHVKVYSEIGHGTSIKLYVPRADPDSLLDESPIFVEGAPSTGHETILVVEDEQAVRAAAVAILTSLGYEVLEAEDGPTALDIVGKNPSIDLLFTDLVMPNGMSGLGLLAKAREHRPDLKVLFTSGYSEHFLEERGTIDQGVQILGKPYRRDTLAKKIREVLDSQSD